MTEIDPRTEWVRWLNAYGAAAFYDAFMHSAQDARGTCRQCGEDIYLDIREGGGIPDWCTEDGDYGCFDSPDTGEDGTGSHEPEKGTAR